MPNEKLEAALALAARGFRVFPCAANSKLPVLQRWPARATTDPETIKTWWSGQHQELRSKGDKKGQPYTISAQSNIGIATGRGAGDTQGVDVIIIDVDTTKREGEADGYAALQELVSKGLPKTYTVRTPSGGLHAYYHSPGRLVKTVAGWRPGIDIRGVGGQGVGPGSTTPKGTYEVLRDLPLAALPLSIAAQLPFKKDPAKEDNRLIQNNQNLLANEKLINDDLITQTGSDYSSFPDSIPHGKHDETLFKYACSWRARGLDRSVADVLMAELAARCDAPGADLQEMATAKLDSAYSDNYKPPTASEWTSVETADGRVAVAPRAEIQNLQASLERFALIEAGSRVVDLQESPKRAIRTLTEFQNAFKNVWVGDKQLPAQWLANGARQTLRDSTYYPVDKRIVELDNCQLYNTYVGPNLPAIAPDEIDEEQIQTFRRHIKYLIPSPAEARLFMKWFIATVKHPERRVQWAPLITGRPGTGKSWLFYLFERLLGEQNCALIGPEHLEMDFNEFMSETVLVCIDEMYTKQRWDVMERIKPMITEKTMEINRKYGAKGAERIFPNFICFSNHREDAIALRPDDRRFWVYNSDAPPSSTEYYDNLFKWLDGPGPAHLRAWALQIDITGFSWGAAPPMTKAKESMIRASRSHIESTILDGIEDRDGIFRFDIVDPDIVEVYVKTVTGTDRLSNAEKYQVGHVLANLSPDKLPQDRYRVHLNGKTENRRRRLRAVRNFTHWAAAPTGEITEEYHRAWQTSLGQEVKTELRSVEEKP